MYACSLKHFHGERDTRKDIYKRITSAAPGYRNEARYVSFCSPNRLRIKKIEHSR